MKLIDNSSRTNWKYIAIVVVLTLVVGGGVWWYGSSLKTDSQPIPIALPRPTSTPTPETIDTSGPALSPSTELGINSVEGWQTYRNDEFGFEVRYPTDRFTMVPVERVGISGSGSGIRDDGLKLIHPNAVERLGRKECWYGEAGFATVCTAAGEDGITFVIVDRDISEYIQALGTGDISEEIILAGRKGFKHALGAEGYNTDYYLVPLTQESTLVITKKWNSGLFGEQGRIHDTVPEFNQILSTFRFVPTP